MIAGIRSLAASVGLELRGGFVPMPGDGVPCQASGQPFAALLMFGHGGSSIWPAFAESAEYADDQPDPLDRWSLRIGHDLAAALEGMALFPFSGPPWHPFCQWAQKAEGMLPSPLGILHHPRHGLWHAYRFAIALPESLPDLPDLPRPARQSHACTACSDRPCLTACPVGAFSEATGHLHPLIHYHDVDACHGYLESHPDATCHLGCRARLACPQGREQAYLPVHREFHMRQFRMAMLGRRRTLAKRVD